MRKNKNGNERSKAVGVFKSLGRSCLTFKLTLGICENKWYNSFEI